MHLKIRGLIVKRDYFGVKLTVMDMVPPFLRKNSLEERGRCVYIDYAFFILSGFSGNRSLIMRTCFGIFA